MSVISWILFILYILAAVLGVVLMIIGFISKDIDDKVAPASFICILSSVVLAFIWMCSAAFDRSRIKEYRLPCESYSVEKMITIVEPSSADSEVKTDTTYIIKYIPKR